MIDNRPIPRLGETMPVAREARYLSGNDRGKHVRLTVPGGKHTGPWELAGEMLELVHWADGTTSMTVRRDDGPALGLGIPPDTIVTITGKAS